MIRKMLIGLGTLVTVVVLFSAVLIWYFYPNENIVLNFIQSNPDKSSIHLLRNDKILASVNHDKIMPLASTVKIIVAIEYAEQAMTGKIDPNREVPIAELERYLVPKTDGDAHKHWKDHIKKKIKEDKIPLKEVAKGMIRFSSNANTEYLMDLLGLDNINQRLEHLGIKKHEPLYYVVSALFVGKEKFPNLKGKALEKALRNLTMQEYKETCDQIHKKLKNDSAGIYKRLLKNRPLSIQKVWSDRLTGSTCEEYADLMKKINDRNYFHPYTQQYLDEIMEWIPEDPVNGQWLTHLGMKGGSTAFVLTKALYATDKKGNKTTMAYFFNDLSYIQNLRLQSSMNEFELKILTDGRFITKLKKVGNHK